MDEWIDSDGHRIAEGYDQTGYDGDAEQSGERVLGQYSAKFTGGQDVVWSREVEFVEPLFANVFLQGSYSYKFGAYTAGEPGLAITLTHRETANSKLSSNPDKTWETEYANTFIAPVFPGHKVSSLGDALGWQQAGWRATTPGGREITKLKIEIVSSTSEAYKVDETNGIHLSQAGGNSDILGSSDADYEWYLDGLGFRFWHPDMRIDQLGRITGAYIAFASIEDAHIKNYIASQSSRILDNPPTVNTALPSWHPDYDNLPDNGQGGKLGDSKYHNALVANSTHAAGWAAEKGGFIKGTGIQIFKKDGNILFSTEGFGPTLTLQDLDETAHTYLYNLSFEESNRTGLEANLSFLAETGGSSPGGALTGNVIYSDVNALYISNSAFNGPHVEYGGLLANGYVTLNGETFVAPPGSYSTGGDSTIRNKAGYLLFLANTQKWSTGGSNSYFYNPHLGDYGLYTFGIPTDAGWIYHPSANDTFQDFAPEFTEADFKTIGRIYTGDTSQILGTSHLDPPRNLDSVTETFGLGGQAPPLGIIAGGILFADLKLNQKNHGAADGWVQFVNTRNAPNTNFVFIHPGGYTDDAGNNPSNIIYECNSAYGISTTGLESLPGSRYIVFVGGNAGRTFTNLPVGHSPDFISALPLGTMPVRWFYEDENALQIEFIPCANDAIIARVDNLDALTHPPLDVSYIYSTRNAMTSEGGFLDDMIIDPPSPATSGGILFADFHMNQETDAAGTLTANLGFLSLTNDESPIQNHFYVVHPENPSYYWQSNNSFRGVPAIFFLLVIVILEQKLDLHLLRDILMFPMTSLPSQNMTNKEIHAMPQILTNGIMITGQMSPLHLHLLPMTLLLPLFVLSTKSQAE